MSGTSLDMSQGSFEKTGNELDVAVQGTGFFVVKTANGPVYTRDGSFQLSADRQLVTAAGDPVLGQGGPITLVPGPISISPDGTISSNGALAGKLQVVEFPAGTQIECLGGTYYSAPAGKAKPSTDSKVLQGVIENSNVNPIAAMVQLVTAQRSAETMQRAMAMFNFRNGQNSNPGTAQGGLMHFLSSYIPEPRGRVNATNLGFPTSAFAVGVRSNRE